jgi:hypothetical protein
LVKSDQSRHSSPTKSELVFACRDRKRLIPTGEEIWIADAHRDDGKRYVVHADEKLTAFLELEAAIRSGRTLRALLSGVK